MSMTVCRSLAAEAASATKLASAVVNFAGLVPATTPPGIASVEAGLVGSPSTTGSPATVLPPSIEFKSNPGCMTVTVPPAPSGTTTGRALCKSAINKSSLNCSAAVLSVF